MLKTNVTLLLKSNYLSKFSRSINRSSPKTFAGENIFIVYLNLILFLSILDILSDTKMYCLVPSDSFTSLQPSTSLCPTDPGKDPPDLCNSAACHFSLSHSFCDTEVSTHTSIQSQTFRKEHRSRGLPRTSSSVGSAFPDPCPPDFSLYPPPRRGGLDPVSEVESVRPHRPGLGGREFNGQLYQQDQAVPSASGIGCYIHKEPCKLAHSASREAGEGSSGLYQVDMGNGGKSSGGRGNSLGGERSADSLRSLSTRSSGSTESYCSGLDRDTNSTVSSFHSEQTSSTHVESLLSFSGDEHVQYRREAVHALAANSRTSSLGSINSHGLSKHSSREANKNPHANELMVKQPANEQSSPTQRLAEPGKCQQEPVIRTSDNGSSDIAATAQECGKKEIEPKLAGVVQRTASLSIGRRGCRLTSKKRASSFDASRHKDYISFRGIAKPYSAVFTGGGEEDSSDQSELSCASSLRSTHHLSTDKSSTTTSHSCHSPEGCCKALKSKHVAASSSATVKATAAPEARRKRARGKQRATHHTPSISSAKTHARVLSLDSGTAACLNDTSSLGPLAGPHPLTTSKSDLEAKEGEVLDAASLLGRASQLESVTRSRNSLPNQTTFEPQDITAASLRGMYHNTAFEHIAFWFTAHV